MTSKIIPILAIPTCAFCEIVVTVNDYIDQQVRHTRDSPIVVLTPKNSWSIIRRIAYTWHLDKNKSKIKDDSSSPSITSPKRMGY